MIRKIYNSKYFPRLFYKKPDGGKESGVTGYFLIEWKILFSIGLLHFKKGSREAYHTHAFNALTWWIKGKVSELHYNKPENNKDFKRSLKPKYTTRDCFHKVLSHENTWALTFRGPWSNIWKEFRERSNKMITLTHGRKELN